MRSRTPTAAAALLLVATALLLCAQGGFAYNVKYTILTTAAAYGTPDTSGCRSNDGALHMAMPPTELGQNLANEASRGASSRHLPLGGEARTAQCSDVDCPWVWNDGLFYKNEYLFFSGVVGGSGGVRRHTSTDNGTVYCNFDSCHSRAGGSFPAYDNSQSYWGNRKVALDVSKGGAWVNIAYNTQFTEWLCEAYEFQIDSVVNDSKRFGLPMWPASHEGSPVVYPDIDVSTYQYCPDSPNKRIEVKSNRYMYPNCKSGFPWWAGLIIAVICFIIVVALILIIWCCCLHCRNKKTAEINEHKVRTQRDNTTNLPTQSQLGMSRASTLNADYYDNQYSDKDSYSRE